MTLAGTPIGAAFERQAKACDELGSPFTARVCRLAVERLEHQGAVADMIRTWPVERAVVDAPALRFCGALHALRRQGWASISAVYPPASASDDDLWSAIATALTEHAGFIAERMQSAPQTNEVRRSAALFPAFAEIADRFPGKPLVLSEIGASAGLNLLFDRYAYRFAGMHYGPAEDVAPFTIAPQWQGRRPAHAEISVRERAGCDLNPLRADNPDDCERLLSYIWADQTDRIERTEKALALARKYRVHVEKNDALQWLAERLDTRREDAVHVVYHTIAWQYLPAAAQREGLDMIAAAGGRASRDAPLCHLAMEADDKGPGAALTLVVYPGGEAHTLGRADFHGRWIDWQL
ncbi:DUF2332 family protein [Martelella lutilitoris]|uniref:DUF2332 family protein n=1 Tax=Martelella lutilitoris TaxID=2583532 RepID=A0A5C4JRM7_9HYPH|nr:DUF2332 family protein [Martelella lutilitoris]TNB47927.1 DUF2332 family protein [Martelella lutilitoris]